MTSDRRARAIRELQPYIERARTFTGWSFEESVDVRALEPPPPWSYDDVVVAELRPGTRVVDFGTGGGEVYSRIIARAPEVRAVATEQWHVNAPIARERLAPLGVHVLRAESERPPFADGTFDVALSRHEGIDPAQVVRVLGGRGVFITQQVWDHHWEELREFFPRKTVWPDHRVEYARALERAGYAVEVREHDWKVAYRKLGDIVFMLLVASWEIEGFDPVAEIDALLALEDKHGGLDGIVLTQSRYLTVARAP